MYPFFNILTDITNPETIAWLQAHETFAIWMVVVWVFMNFLVYRYIGVLCIKGISFVLDEMYYRQLEKIEKE